MEKNQNHGRRRKSSKVPLQFFFVPIVLRRRSKISQRDLSCLFSWSNYYHLHLCLSLPSFNISPSSLSLSLFLSLSFFLSRSRGVSSLIEMVHSHIHIPFFFLLLVLCITPGDLLHATRPNMFFWYLIPHTITRTRTHTHSHTHAHCHSWLLVRDCCGFTDNVNLWSHNWNVQGQFLLILFSMPRPKSNIESLRLKLPWQWL